MQKSTAVQLVRDIDEEAAYSIYTKETKLILHRTYWSQTDTKVSGYLALFCPEEMEPFLPTSLHLPPGGGPVNITITIKDSK